MALGVTCCTLAYGLKDDYLMDTMDETMITWSSGLNDLETYRSNMVRVA